MQWSPMSSQLPEAKRGLATTGDHIASRGRAGEAALSSCSSRLCRTSVLCHLKPIGGRYWNGGVSGYWAEFSPSTQGPMVLAVFGLCLFHRSPRRVAE